MVKPVILVSGKNGQLGQELQSLSRSLPGFEFVFAGKEEMDLSDVGSLHVFFEKYTPAFFINCAAYTAVDKAEKEKEIAYAINATAVGMVAQLCGQWNTTLIHISTDYVFNGEGQHPYNPEDETDPVNYYGYSKLAGELLALEKCSKTIILRTSWVYSSYGNNFVKTMLRLMRERNEINVVQDQKGSPTYAADLAEAIIRIISIKDQNFEQRKGIYHFSNSGAISWYDFALAIRDLSGSSCKINPIPSEAYPTPAKRPHFSVMNTDKISSVFGLEIKNWKSRLNECLLLMQQQGMINKN